MKLPTLNLFVLYLLPIILFGSPALIPYQDTAVLPLPPNCGYPPNTLVKIRVHGGAQVASVSVSLITPRVSQFKSVETTSAEKVPIFTGSSGGPFVEPHTTWGAAPTCSGLAVSIGC